MERDRSLAEGLAIRLDQTDDANGVVGLEVHGSPGDGSVLREHRLQDALHPARVRAAPVDTLAAHMPNRTRRVSISCPVGSVRMP